MSALRRALLGSVFVTTSLFAHPVAHAAAVDAQGGTAWAESVHKALAANGMQDVADAGTGSVSGRDVSQKGMASWYGGRHHLRRTSSGSRFDKNRLTAAHPTAPLGSKLLVTSEETGRSVVVTVNDRGPYSRGRIIDLSQAAAAKLGMLNSGVAHVSVQTATPEEVAAAPEDAASPALAAPAKATAGKRGRPLHLQRKRFGHP
ncbi:MAG: septal ring lytic transglycosylase RlpA family protein [Acetobacter sp.]|uniref:Endolytic peptidoglycan transglycosylase RlpA n=1 Tax=Acetobacter syzygii TaxID=146476 RepID=A0A270BL53_9PROT|nr:septal ring lytic transglycosylase RlpA family protein [Acetobacter syzygii]NSL91353.1 septal ring lytic transglycosylase RlpA family protein [Acetobacter syzygii]PAL25773.1 septal ring lytic transglycosylase RlpA family lipoprotein [Acetobacter syzygii]PAL25884.1 septal ring lytic transglycosylase RlpA family lipoprotein [Acetobacter syzygii]